MQGKSIVIFGAGSVGRSLYAWLAPNYQNLYLLARGETLNSLREQGVSSHHHNSGFEKDEKIHPVKVISDLKELPSVDVLILTVKNYHLEKLCQDLKSKLTNPNCLVISTQNGMLAQRVLPRYFKRCLFMIIGYNAWLDETGMVHYQNRGPVVLGCLDPAMDASLANLAPLFLRSMPTIISSDIRAAAYCKLVVNLANSLTTLIGHGQKPVSDMDLFQKVLTQMTYEAIKVLAKAGIKEQKIPHLPSWMVLKSAALLPQFLTRPLFQKNLKKMVMSSMAQDLAKNPGGDHELDTINGEILNLGNSLKVPMPVNQAVFDLCQKYFAQKEFKPIDISEVGKAISWSK
jgi:2-dehydropantoate 2-reductase